jgi:hypothetical protein
MRWTEVRRATLLAPVVALMCADSPAPGGCGGAKPSAPEQGTLSCAMSIDGADVPCTGEWRYWKEDHHYIVDVYGNRDGSLPAARVSADFRSEAAGAELMVGVDAVGARVDTAAGTYAAGSLGPGSTGALQFSSLSPLTGTYSLTLAPLVTDLHVWAPEGTTVKLEVRF